MLIGTAGHIDHGKTTLVRALTGVDTDRLPEEKRRGITIELGYAYLPCGTAGDSSPEQVIGFVDVPGHEKFVPTMLAGASGVDFALLVVAADDGPMPQTREHLQILELLGLGRGAVALTKADRASPEQIARVSHEIAALLAPTRLAGAPVFPLSAITGEGVAALREHLFDIARSLPPPAGEGGFRLAVDRVFTLPGAGTIVAGSVHAGQVSVGDTLLVAPAGTTARVRSLHVQNRKAEQGRAGQRCALNLAGLSVDQVKRGDWLCGSAQLLPATRLDIDLQLATDAPRTLAHGAVVQIHHGTRHLLGRVALLDAGLEKSGLPPGGRSLAQVVADAPLHACRGDLVVLRDGHGRHTLGGGRILDPFGPTRQRRHPERLAILAAQALSKPAERLQALLEHAPLGLGLSQLAAAENQRSADLLALLPSETLHLTDKADWLIGHLALATLAGRVSARLAEYHAQHGDELGLERDRLRRMAAPQAPAAAFAEWLELWLGKGLLARSGSAWHLPDHRVELDARDRRLADTLLPWLQDAVFEPPWVRDIATRLGQPEALTRDLLKRLAARGEACQVVRDLFYAPATVRRLGAIAGELMAEQGAIRAADFRDRTGLGRKRAIQILEYFDRVGFTRKVGHGHGEQHRIRGDLPVN